jgi:hypothetical protein
MALTAMAQAQMPAPLMGKGSGTNPAGVATDRVAWQQAKPSVVAALECRSKLPHSDAVKAEFHLTNDSLDGITLTLPEPVTVFGYKVIQFDVFESADEGTSYTVTLPGVSLIDVARHAHLRKEGERYVCVTKIGHLEATVQSGGVVLSCNVGGGDDQG